MNGAEDEDDRNVLHQLGIYFINLGWKQLPDHRGGEGQDEEQRESGEGRKGASLQPLPKLQREDAAAKTDQQAWDLHQPVADHVREGVGIDDDGFHAMRWEGCSCLIGLELVPGKGLEPSRFFNQRILSPQKIMILNDLSFMLPFC